MGGDFGNGDGKAVIPELGLEPMEKSEEEMSGEHGPVEPLKFCGDFGFLLFFLFLSNEDDDPGNDVMKGIAKP